MPQTRVWIEELGPGRWVAEVEMAGSSPARRSVRGADFDEIIRSVLETHAAQMAEMSPAVRPVKEVLADQAARDAAVRVADDAAARAADNAAAAALRAEDAAFEQAHAAEESERLVGEADERKRQDDAAAPVAPDQRADLIAQAEAMGLTIDRRWGDARLRDVVAAEHARRAATA